MSTEQPTGDYRQRWHRLATELLQLARAMLEEAKENPYIEGAYRETLEKLVAWQHAGSAKVEYKPMSQEDVDAMVGRLTRDKEEASRQVDRLRLWIHAKASPLFSAATYTTGYTDPQGRRGSLELAIEHVTAMPERGELLQALQELGEHERKVEELNEQIKKIL